MTRLSPEALVQITGKRRPSAQARWFAQRYGVDLPLDSAGPVITGEAFEALVRRACGLEAIQPARPRLRLQR